MRISRPRLGSLAVAIALASASLGLSLGWQVPSVAAAAANTQAGELVQLINGTRATAGLPAFATDPLLASLSRDGTYRCGDTPYKTISGRARDFATYRYFSHKVRNCLTSSFSLSTRTFVSVLQTDFGFGSVGEILASNTGFGTADYEYTYSGWTTSVSATAGRAMAGWMGSPTHKAIVLGGYNRVGCGAWLVGTSSYYFDCLFSVGGGHGWTPPVAPPAPTKAPTKAPSATIRVNPAPATVLAAASATATPTVTADATVTAEASPSEEVAGMVATSATPTIDAAVAARLAGGGGDSPTRDLAVRGGILAGAVLALFVAAGLMLRLFRRGPGGTIA